MRAIRSIGNRSTEIRLASLFREYSIVGWRRHVAIFGRPDFVFRRERLVVFVDGCFWHGCSKHGRQPGSNQEYWIAKLSRNQKRDKAVNRELKTKGWRVLRFWHHDLANPERVVKRVRAALNAPIPKGSPSRKRVVREGSKGK